MGTLRCVGSTAKVKDGFATLNLKYRDWRTNSPLSACMTQVLVSEGRADGLAVNSIVQLVSAAGSDVSFAVTPGGRLCTSRLTRPLKSWRCTETLTLAVCPGSRRM